MPTHDAHLPKAAKPRPVRPRDAATLILVDRSAAKPFILMGRRPARSKFLPDAYVFPGGAVEPQDRVAGVARGLAPAVIETLCVAGDARRAHGLAVAAVRETFEETGLLIAGPGNVGAIEGPTWQALRDRSLAPDLGSLAYFARAITPTHMHKRFHARFFIADANETSGDVTSNGELLDLHWVSLDQAGDLPTVDVTRFILAELRRHLAGQSPAKRPLWTFRDGKEVIR
ncbi:MAG: NUDIX hydrolase [Alphaproteobacteria bacterium]